MYFTQKNKFSSNFLLQRAKSEKYKKKIRLSVRIHKHREADFDLFLQGIAN